MDQQDYFKDISEVTRYNNALLNEIRKINQLLEQLILKIEPVQVVPVPKPKTQKSEVQ